MINVHYSVLYGNNKNADIVLRVHGCSPVNMWRFFYSN